MHSNGRWLQNLPQAAAAVERGGGGGGGGGRGTASLATKDRVKVWLATSYLGKQVYFLIA